MFSFFLLFIFFLNIEAVGPNKYLSINNITDDYFKHLKFPTLETIFMLKYI